jgi:hypothetical protein
MCIWLYVLYASVRFCNLCICIVVFMYSDCYVEVFLLLCSVLCILFHYVVLCIVCV